MTYRLRKKINRHVVNKNRDLLHDNDILYNSNTDSKILNEYHPDYMSNKNINGYRLDKNTTTLVHEDYIVDNKYAECKESLNDNTYYNLALALFILVIIGVVVFVLNSLLFWNKRSLTEHNSFSIPVFMLLILTFHAMIFSQFYEFKIPPTIDLFLRHCYRLAIQWHGAFREHAINGSINSVSLKTAYYDNLLQKRFDMGIVHNILINIGVILIILFVLYILCVVFSVLLTKKLPCHFEQYEMNNIKSDKTWVNLPFMDRFSLSFAMKMIYVGWLVFSVELPFYIVHEFVSPSFEHGLFQASFAFAIIIGIIHLVIIGFVMFVAARLNSFYMNKEGFTEIPTTDIIENTKLSTIVVKDDKKDSNIKKVDKVLDIMTKGSKTVQSTLRGSSYYYYLFVVQGTKRNTFAVFQMSIIAIIFTLFGITISAGYANKSNIAVWVNTVFIIGLMVYMFIYPTRYPLIAKLMIVFALLLFFLAHLLLAILSTEADSMFGNNGCRIGTAVLALFFVSIVILLLTMILAMINDMRKKVTKVINEQGNDGKEWNIPDTLQCDAQESQILDSNIVIDTPSRIIKSNINSKSIF